MKITQFVLFFLSMMFMSLSHATPASEELFAKLKTQGASHFSVAQGNKDWTKEFADSSGEKRSCTTCHGSDLSKPGKHHTTGKVIEPMTPAVNPDRFTDLKKMEKWFKRNCEWTYGRECTAQEKGDILKFLLGAS